MTTRRGFTLIEILVVVSIIALLAAILFPVFAQVRGKGRQAACLSNLRQLGHAMTMYTQDYERYPHAIDPADRFTEIWDQNPIINGITLQEVDMLTDVMQPYVKNAQVWRCPSDTGFDSPDSIEGIQLENEPTTPSCFVKYGTSYFYRTELMFRNLAEDHLKEPTKINVLFDAHGDWHGSKFLGRRGERRYNVLFADGHVKNLNGDQMDEAWLTPVQ